MRKEPVEDGLGRTGRAADLMRRECEIFFGRGEMSVRRSLALVFLLVALVSVAGPIGARDQYRLHLPLIRNDGPTAAPDCVYVGSINSDKYHCPTCHHAGNILPENRICFSSKEEAEAEGYVPCKVCLSHKWEVEVRGAESTISPFE